MIQNPSTTCIIIRVLGVHDGGLLRRVNVRGDVIVRIVRVNVMNGINRLVDADSQVRTKMSALTVTVSVARHVVRFSQFDDMSVRSLAGIACQNTKHRLVWNRCRQEWKSKRSEYKSNYYTTAVHNHWQTSWLRINPPWKHKLLFNVTADSARWTWTWNENVPFEMIEDCNILKKGQWFCIELVPLIPSAR